VAAAARPRVVVAGLLGTLVLGGCFGSGSSHKAGSLKAPINASRKVSLLGGAGSAGPAQSYVPTGKIVADSGFRPQANGFAFENYGNDAGPVNMTPANVEDMFGSQVCLPGTSGSNCNLIPSAKLWLQRINASMANGHCYGFSVSALRFFTHNLDPSAYGASPTFQLPIQGNTTLQSLIAEDFAYQDLQSVRKNAIVGTPTQVLNALVQALNSGKDAYTLAIIKADGSGGHAITPIAVEDKGGGRAAIIVYDNNFPGILRAVQVDTGSNTWTYVGGINPSQTGEIYRGDAQTQSMLLFPTKPGEGTQPCPFCPAKQAAPGSTVLDQLHFIEVALVGSGAEHPHLVFADDQGRQTGFVGGRLLQQVPGIQVVQNYSVQNWNSSPEPVFHLPLGHPAYHVTVDGTSLTKPIETSIQVNGAGVAFYIRQIRMAPGQRDTLLLPAKNLAVSYATTSHFPATAIIQAAFADIDHRYNKARLIVLTVGALGYAPGSPVVVILAPASSTAYVSSLGDTPLVPQARYALSVDSSPLGSGGLPEGYYYSTNLYLRNQQTAHFLYIRPTGPTLPVELLDQNFHVVGHTSLPAAASPPSH
jgi:hypothetical protein